MAKPHGLSLPHIHLPHLKLPEIHLQQLLPWRMGAGGDGAAGAGGGTATAVASAKPCKLAVNFSGRWQKDGARSTPMTDALRLMAINGLMRQAIKLVRGCNIQQSDDEFIMDVTSVIGWFKVRERYKLNGEVSLNKRRDWRGGRARGVAKALAPDKLQLRSEFDDPHGGIGTDIFHMPTPDELHIETVIISGGETAKFESVYHRRK